MGVERKVVVILRRKDPETEHAQALLARFAPHHLIALPVKPELAAAEFVVFFAVVVTAESIFSPELVRSELGQHSRFAEEKQTVLRGIGIAAKHQAVVVRIGRIRERHEQTHLGVVPVDRLDPDCSTPTRETRREGNIAAEAVGTGHRIVGEEARHRLVDKLLLRLQPSPAEHERVIASEHIRHDVIQTGGHQTPTDAAGIAGRIEEAVAIDDIVRIRGIGRIPPAHLAEGAEATQSPELCRLGQVEPSFENDLLREGVARAILAREDAVINSAPAAVEGEPVIRHRRTHAAQFAGHGLRIPPFPEGGALLLRRAGGREQSEEDGDGNGGTNHRKERSSLQSRHVK